METSSGTVTCWDESVTMLVVLAASEFAVTETDLASVAVLLVACFDIPSHRPIKVMENYIKDIVGIIDIATFCRGATTVIIHNYVVNL